MADTIKKRLSPEEKIAQLEQEIADRRAAAAQKAGKQAGLKKHQLNLKEQKLSEVENEIDELVSWFNDNNLDHTVIEPVAPVKPTPKPKGKVATKK